MELGKNKRIVHTTPVGIDYREKKKGESKHSNDDSPHLFESILDEEFNDVASLPDPLGWQYKRIQELSTLDDMELQLWTDGFKVFALDLVHVLSNSYMNHWVGIVGAEGDVQLALKALFSLVLHYGHQPALESILHIWREINVESELNRYMRAFSHQILSMEMLPLSVYKRQFKLADEREASVRKKSILLQSTLLDHLDHDFPPSKLGYLTLRGLGAAGEGPLNLK
jgi:hypothetical protein